MNSALKGKVVVITGASSGIGRQTSVAFARLGCRVVVAARRLSELQACVELCRSAGGEAIAVSTDVTQEEAVRALVRRTLQEWSQIDIWVNNAGTTLFSYLAQSDFGLHRQVLETNLIGAMLCARAVLPVFHKQRFGTLINVGSILSKVGQAFVPSYVISKFGVRGLSEALRAEVADEPHIHVCTIMPYTVDTPHFQAGANITGKEAHAMPPVQSAERISRAIVDLAKRPRREIHVPRYAVLGLALHRLFPRTAERLLLHALRSFHLGAEETPTLGSLFRPSSEPGSVTGRRRPLITNGAFVLWVVGDVARMAAASARRILRG